MFFDFANVLVFLIIGVLFVSFTLIFSWIVRPHKPNPGKATSYECGERTIGSSWVRFNIRFYVIALLFIIFDVEILLLFPWAVVYKELGLIAFIEMLVFVGLLLIGLAYLWKKGDLDWIKPKSTKELKD